MKTAKDLKIPFGWEERHPILLDRFFYVPASYPYQKETVPLFSSEKPIAIEYCSGNGQWIGQKARENPDLNWIAVEKKFERARKIWLKMHREGIENLCVVCGEALIFTRYFAPKVSIAYINFPDPWPKLRHAKHRLVREEFLGALEQILNGSVTCATDDANYYLQMKQVFALHPKFTLVEESRDLSDYGASFFKDLWAAKGRSLQYVTYSTHG